MNGSFVKLLVAAALGTVSMYGTTVTVSLGSDPFPNGTTAPYIGTVGNVTTKIVCDDEFDTVFPNESWTANVLTLNNLNASNYKSTRFGANYSLSVATKLYDEVAYLVLQFANTPTSDWAAIQTAVWQVFDPAVSSIGSSGATSSAYWSNLAANNYASVTPFASSIQILTPVAGTQRPIGLGLPQEYIAISNSPEPATLAMFGAGIVLLSLGSFRRRRKDN